MTKAGEGKNADGVVRRDGQPLGDPFQSMQPGIVQSKTTLLDRSSDRSKPPATEWAAPSAPAQGTLFIDTRIAVLCLPPLLPEAPAFLI